MKLKRKQKVYLEDVISVLINCRCKIYVISFLAANFMISGGISYAQNTSEGLSSNKGPVNIVLFIADDLGYNDTGPYGNRVVETPNLDKLAGQSLIFTEAYASSPTCSPSRASIHTGMQPFRNGAHANHSGIKEGIRTLPVYLNELGYNVALAGKYHIGPEEYYPFQLIHNTNVPESGHEDDGVLWTDLKMGPVDKWLENVSKEEDSFMLVVNDHSPHVRWPENPDYNSSAIDIPSTHIDTEETREARSKYYADISKLDRNVGKLLESLNDHNLAKNTVVIFTSDQGPQWAFGKWNLYDYGIQVPMLVRWPNVIKGGTDTDALVSLVDLLPTIIELADGNEPEKPEKIDGKSFLPILLNEQLDHRDHVYASHTGDQDINRSPMRMIRTKRYKYILNLAPDIQYETHIDQNDFDNYWESWVEKSFKDKDAASVLRRYHNRPREELYDVQVDPKEIRNLAEAPYYKNILGKFRTDMRIWRDQQGDKETGPYIPSEDDGDKIPYIF